MNDGLKDTVRRALVTLLSSNPRVKRIVLFGSRAMGTYRPASDIDLALQGPELRLSDLLEFKRHIAELNLLHDVDLVIYDGIGNKDLLDHIVRHGVCWWPEGGEE
ncbi:MAG: nucleotidyltransferase domain-containing protein [Akkermansia sp.]|nr:nucleotidyltransferase domain-containing protein [Akkermansia sp.]